MLLPYGYLGASIPPSSGMERNSTTLTIPSYPPYSSPSSLSALPIRFSPFIHHPLAKRWVQGYQFQKIFKKLACEQVHLQHIKIYIQTKCVSTARKSKFECFGKVGYIIIDCITVRSSLLSTTTSTRNSNKPQRITNLCTTQPPTAANNYFTNE